jgi:hypothetical protein
MTVNVSFRETAYGRVIGSNANLIPYVVVYSGEHTTIGGAAAEAKTLAGVLATDVVVANISFTGTVAVTLYKAVPTANTITFTFSGNPNAGTAHKVMYAVLRAAA